MHKITRYLSLMIGLCMLFLTSPINAEQYGPTKASDSLWKIAKAVPTGDKSIKTMQVVIAIYRLNPTAFNSGNMNELKKGVYLNLPDDMEVVTQLSYREAKKEYKDHLQQLDILQANAKDLSKAKSRYAKWKKEYNSIKREISVTTTLSYEEKLLLSKKLKRSARKQAKWKKEVKKLRQLLLQKAALKKTVPPPPTLENKVQASETTESQKTTLILSDQSVESSTEDTSENKQSELLNKNNDALKARLTLLENKINRMLVTQSKETNSRDQQITQLREELEKSSQLLQEKLANQTQMEERLIVLEGELGEKEQVIQKLRRTLATAADTMKQQQQENENLQKKLKILDATQTVVPNKRLELLSPEKTTSEVINKTTSSPFKAAVPDSSTMTKEASSETKALQLLFTLSTLSLLLLLLFFYLRKRNRQRKFRQRMEVIELKLKSVDSSKKVIENPFKKSA